MLINGTKTEIKSNNNWPTEEVESGHSNLSLFKVTQPDKEIRYVFAIKLQAVAMPKMEYSPLIAIDEMIEHLKWMKDHPYVQSFISSD